MPRFTTPCFNISIYGSVAQPYEQYIVMLFLYKSYASWSLALAYGGDYTRKYCCGGSTVSLDKLSVSMLLTVNVTYRFAGIAVIHTIRAGIDGVNILIGTIGFVSLYMVRHLLHWLSKEITKHIEWRFVKVTFICFALHKLFHKILTTLGNRRSRLYLSLEICFRRKMCWKLYLTSCYLCT